MTFDTGGQYHPHFDHCTYCELDSGGQHRQHCPLWGTPWCSSSWLRFAQGGEHPLANISWPPGGLGPGDVRTDEAADEQDNNFGLKSVCLICGREFPGDQLKVYITARCYGFIPLILLICKTCEGDHEVNSGELLDGQKD